MKTVSIVGQNMLPLRFRHKPTGAVFDGAYRLRARIEPCSVADVAEPIAKHYLHRRPGVVVLAMRVTVDDELMGAIVFALPPSQINVRYGDGANTWELARLWLSDQMPTNSETWVIGQALRYIRRCEPAVTHIVSYADTARGHTGVIYRASGFSLDGMTDQERKSPRCDYVDAAGKKYSRKGHVPNGVTVKRVPRSSKFRYVMAMRPKQRKAVA